jgi:hypothetical protein
MLSVIMMVSLAVGVSSCGKRVEYHAFPDSERIEGHPTNPDKVCMDIGYLFRIDEMCEANIKDLPE